MNHVKKGQLQTLDEFAEYMTRACEKNNIPLLDPFDSRRFAAAPDKSEWAAHHGIDILRLESKGVYSPDSDNSTYARLLEADLSEAFWDSNNTRQLGLPSMEPLPEMGCQETPMPAGELPSSLSRYLQQTPPNNLRTLASLLLGGVARARSRDPSKRPADSFEPGSRKIKSGRRDYAKAPSFAQWAAKAGIKLNWLSKAAVEEGTKVFNRLLEDILTDLFWPRHRKTERRHMAKADDIPALRPQTGEPSENRVIHPGSITLDARRDRLPTTTPNPDGLVYPDRPQGKQTGDLGKITLWLESMFVDYDPELLRGFLTRFPRIRLETVLDVARNMWRRTDGRQGDEKYVNFQKFLHRLSAVDTLRNMQTRWSTEQIQNFVFFDLNHIYSTIDSGCETVCKRRLDPYDLILKLPSMPVVLDMNDADLKSAVQRVLTTASRIGQDVNPQQYMEAVATAVRSGNASKEQQGNVLALAKEMAAADIGRKPDPPYALPVPLGVGGDTLHALQNVPFGLESTQEMVKTAIRRGLDPQPVMGPGWVLPSGVGGGVIQGKNRQQALLRAQVEEAIRSIRADYGVDAAKAKAKEVQEKINFVKRGGREPREPRERRARIVDDEDRDELLPRREVGRRIRDATRRAVQRERRLRERD